MDISAPDKDEIQTWVDQALSGSDLIRGKISNIGVDRTRSTDIRGWEIFGGAASEILPIASIDAQDHPTWDSFLTANAHEHARHVITGIDRVILSSSRISDGGVAETFHAAAKNLPAAPIGAILAWEPHFYYPSDGSVPVHSSDAVEPYEALFLHPGPQSTYLIRAWADFRLGGPTGDTLLMALLAQVLKPTEQLGARMTRVRL